MKNKQLIHVVYFFILILLSSCENDKNPVSIQENMQVQSEYFYVIRSLDEINTDDNAEAYPWISADGLTLYYTKGYNHNSIYFAHRDSLCGVFTDIKPVNIILTTKRVNIISCWLTENQLEIYFKRSPHLYYAKRNSTSDDFINPVIVELEGRDPNKSLLGPSLTQDKSQLFISCDLKTHIYSAIDETHFILTDSLIGPTDTGSLGPGQLSKDDLKYFTSIGNTNGEKEIIYYTRKSIHDKFDTLCEVDSAIQSGYKMNFLPAVSADENVLVYARKNEPLWDHNNLFIAEKRLDIKK